MFGPELALNPGLDTSQNWESGGGWSNADSKAVFSYTEAYDQLVQRNTSLIAGRKCHTLLEITDMAGSGEVGLFLGNGSESTFRNSDGVFEENITVVAEEGGNGIFIKPNNLQAGFSFKIPRISVKEIIAPAITAITEASGIVTLTVSAEGTVDIYSRPAGTSVWALSAEAQAAGAIAIEGLTAGATYEFYAIETYDGEILPPSNLVYIYLHNSALPTVAEVERWAVGVLLALGVFKTVAVWKHQLSADAGGLTNLDKHAPCAFVGEQPTMNAEREGGYILNRKIVLVIIVAQKTLTDGGAARVGDDTILGTEELRSLVIAALDKQNPGGGLGVDDFYYTGAEEIIDTPKQHGVKMVFEANWLSN